MRRYSPLIKFAALMASGCGGQYLARHYGWKAAAIGLLIGLAGVAYGATDYNGYEIGIRRWKGKL